MAAVAATASCTTVANCLVQKSLVATSSRVAAPVNGSFKSGRKVRRPRDSTAATSTGLPALRMPRLVCSAEKKEETRHSKIAASAASFAAFAAANPGAAFALVDERLSTEGTGLKLGLSNSKLAWILIGVTALIWSLYFVYSSGLPEGDDNSGLDL